MPTSSFGKLKKYLFSILCAVLKVFIFLYVIISTTIERIKISIVGVHEDDRERKACRIYSKLPMWFLELMISVDDMYNNLLHKRRKNKEQKVELNKTEEICGIKFYW